MFHADMAVLRMCVCVVCGVLMIESVASSCLLLLLCVCLVWSLLVHSRFCMYYCVANFGVVLNEKGEKKSLDRSFSNIIAVKINILMQ